MKNKFKLIGIIALAALIIPVTAHAQRRNFIYESPDFNPAHFTARAFDDVIAATTGEHNITGTYISELIFLRQSGRVLTFQSPNNSTTRDMQIQSAPEGLSQGQRVRVYYYVSSNMTRRREFLEGNAAWGVFAIERL